VEEYGADESDGGEMHVPNWEFAVVCPTSRNRAKSNLPDNMRTLGIGKDRENGYIMG
jgi:hypothetical protein